MSTQDRHTTDWTTAVTVFILSDLTLTTVRLANPVRYYITLFSYTSFGTEHGIEASFEQIDAAS